MSVILFKVKGYPRRGLQEGSLTVSEVDHTVTHIGIEDIVGNWVPHNITIVNVKGNLEPWFGAPSECLLACTCAV